MGLRVLLAHSIYSAYTYVAFYFAALATHSKWYVTIFFSTIFEIQTFVPSFYAHNGVHSLICTKSFSKTSSFPSCANCETKVRSAQCVTFHYRIAFRAQRLGNSARCAATLSSSWLIRHQGSCFSAINLSSSIAYTERHKCTFAIWHRPIRIKQNFATTGHEKVCVCIWHSPKRHWIIGIDQIPVTINANTPAYNLAKPIFKHAPLYLAQSKSNSASHRTWQNSELRLRPTTFLLSFLDCERRVLSLKRLTFSFSFHIRGTDLSCLAQSISVLTYMLANTTALAQPTRVLQHGKRCH